MAYAPLPWGLWVSADTADCLQNQPESLTWSSIWVMLQTAEGILKPVGQPELPAGGTEP